MKPGRGYGFLIGLSLGAAIWLLSPLVTGRREPWDAEGAYYVGTLFGAGILGGLAVPTHWGSTTFGVFTGQALVLLGGVLAEPASGGLWPLGLVFLGFYSVLALFGTGVGATLHRLWTRRKGSREPDEA